MFYRRKIDMNGTRNAATKADAESEAAVMLSEPITATCKAYFVDLPLTMTNEILHFAARRLEKQAKLASALSGCKTLSEAAEAQSAFFRGAVKDYQKEPETAVHRARDAIS
jgi:hypothetical protein